MPKLNRQLIHEDTYWSLRRYFADLPNAICALCGCTFRTHMVASFCGIEVEHSFESYVAIEPLGGRGGCHNTVAARCGDGG